MLTFHNNSYLVILTEYIHLSVCTFGHKAWRLTGLLMLPIRELSTMMVG